MLLPEASDEGRDVAEPQADREICNRKVFDHCVPPDMWRQCGCAEAGGAGDRVGRVGSPGRRLWRRFDAGRLACADSYSKAVDLNLTSWTATQATAVGVLTSQAPLFEALTVQNAGPIPKGVLRTFTESQNSGSSGG
jgi:hypothetical protein